MMTIEGWEYWVIFVSAIIYWISFGWDVSKLGETEEKHYTFTRVVIGLILAILMTWIIIT